MPDFIVCKHFSLLGLKFVRFVYTLGKVNPVLENVLQKMLQLDPCKRISAKAALQHPYFDDLDKSQF